MDDIKTASIDSRKTALMQMVNPNDKGIISAIDAYFEKVEEFAKGCSDVADFESKFQSSPLASEYTELFTRVTTSSSDDSEDSSLAKEIKDEMVDDVYRYGRRKARQEAYDQARDIPGVGKALEVKQYADLFGMFRRKKGDDE